MEQVCYRYDGTFEGFLTCIFESYVNKETPAAFLTAAEGEQLLWRERTVESSRPHALRVYRALAGRMSERFQHIIEKGFLTCLPERELALYALIRRGFAQGDRARLDLTEPTVARLMLAIRKLDTEVDHLKGFVRFSDLDGVLVGEIEPKNRVLPLLAPHFALRLPLEKFVLHDRTNREALFYVNRQWRIVPVEDFHMGPAGLVEEQYRALWRRFFKTIAIEGRRNPKCQATHLPKRYRGVMTEFQEENIDRPALG